MKKTGIISGIVLFTVFSLFFLVTRPVDHSPFYESTYFRSTLEEIGRLKGTETVYDSVQAGFAFVSLTPGLNNQVEVPEQGKFMHVPLAGYGKREGKSASGIHDSVFVKAVALKVGAKRMVFVGTDMLIVPPNIADSVSNILKLKGIGRDEIFYSATHTHSGIGGWGPGYLGEQFAGKYNANIQKWIADQVVKAIVASLSDLKPASVGSGMFQAKQFIRNRLVDSLGITNPDFNYLLVRQTRGRTAVIGSFSAHSTTLGHENMLFSGDYPGFWQRLMEKTSVDMALFMAGSTGSQAPVTQGSEFEQPRFIGEALADSLNLILPATRMEDKTFFKAVSLKFALPEYHIRISKNRNLIPSLGNKLMPVPQNPYIQVVRVGQTVWVSVPADFSGEYAVQIKNNLKAKGFDCNISGFNGSYLGYILPGRYFYLNKYESRLMGWFGPNMGDYTVDIIRQLSEDIMQ